MSRTFSAFLAAIALTASLVAPLPAATLPSGFTESLVADGLATPSAMAFAPDGRLFVLQQGGQVRVIKDGVLLATPFVSLSVDANGERGLLGIAFDPDFAANQHVYLYYTPVVSPRRNRISRFTASGDFAAAGSEAIIVDLDPLTGATNHNGGAMHFGPDGKLYVAVGENATPSHAQTLANRHGKMLRLNRDGSIPTDNPFYNTATGVNRAIWALGLRNPFTFAFQPGTGRMFINDVGAGTWEEVNDGIAGANYGWPATEGPTTNPQYRAPLHAYQHGSGSGTGCAITGGTFYNPPTPNFPSEYVGQYFFADYCSGWIRRYNPATGAANGFISGVSLPVDLKVGPDGTLYYLARGSGAVYRVSSSSQAPQVTTQPANRTVTAGQTATFTAAASGSQPLTYQWERNGTPISGATTASYTTPATTAADNGAQFRVVVTNAFGSAVSTPATLTVTANTAPVAAISTPVNGTRYAAGNTISYSGGGTDAEDGTLPNSALTWRVDFHHDDHTHPFVPATTGVSGGSMTIPTSGETSANVFYRIHLTVRDAGGLTHSTFRDVRPRTATITLAGNPAGLQLTLDGQPVTAPMSVLGVVGIVRTLGVVSPQTLGGVSYRFVSWSDGGAATHNIATPAANTTYTATFQPVTTGGTSGYLSDRAWSSVTNGWGPVERDRSNGEQAADDGRVLTLNGVTYAKGLGVHANSEVRVNVGGACSTFQADIGVDDEVGGNGSVEFQVLADGVSLYQSGLMTGSTATKAVSVALTGRAELVLRVTAATGGTAYDHADWADARVSCGTATTTPISDLAWTSVTNGWGPVERDRSNGEQAAGDGRVLTLNGVTYAKGLGVHATSEVRYALEGRCTTFQADVGVDDEVGANGSVTFQVRADNVLLYDSGVMTGDSATRSVNVALNGRNELSLRVTAASGGNAYDHADWANARLTCTAP